MSVENKVKDSTDNVEQVVEEAVESAIVQEANMLGVPKEVTQVTQESLRHLTFCQHISALAVLGGIVVAANVLLAMFVHKPQN